MIKKIFTAGLALGAITGPVAGQQPIISPRDTFHLSLPAAPVFRTTQAGIIVPAMMIAYGFTALKAHALVELNRTTKDELREDHPNFHTHADNYLQYAPVAAVYLLNAAGVHGKHNLRDRSIILGISAVLTAGSVELIKRSTHEVRPDGSDALSFPSGHTATAFAAAEFLRQEYKDVSPWYGVGGYAAAAATGALRMYNNKHWFSDVVAGAGFGILSSKAAYWVYPRIQRAFFRGNSSRTATVLLPYYNPQWHTAGLSFVYYPR